MYESVRQYFFVKRRDFAHYEYTWNEAVATATESGPTTIADLEATKNWDQLYQFIFGFKPQVRTYVYLPTDTERHGIAKRPKHTSAYTVVAHYDMWMSPWDDPDWLTEHFLLRPITPFVAFSIYNPTAITVTPQFNFFINKLEIEKIGEEDSLGALTPCKPKFAETLEKLSRYAIPHRPITLLTVRAPATAE